MTAPVNVMAHLPVTQLESWYRLGAGFVPESRDVYFNTTDSDGIRIVAGEPDGWEGVEFILPLDTVGGKDGGHVGPQSVGPKVLYVQGMAVAPDARLLRLLIARIRSLLGPRRAVVWEQHDYGAAERLGLVCRSEGDFRATPVQGNMNGGVATRITFTLVAASPPWKFTVGNPDVACAGLPTGDIAGRSYDKDYDKDYGGIFNPGGELQAENRGDLEAWPVFEITGPVDHPVITNDTTGREFLISGSIPAGETVTVDARTGVVTPGGYRVIGRPWSLAPGDNTVRWRATFGSFDPDALLCLSWRSTSS